MSAGPWRLILLRRSADDPETVTVPSGGNTHLDTRTITLGTGQVGGAGPLGSSRARYPTRLMPDTDIGLPGLPSAGLA